MIEQQLRIREKESLSDKIILWVLRIVILGGLGAFSIWMDYKFISVWVFNGGIFDWLGRLTFLTIIVMSIWTGIKTKSFKVFFLSLGINTCLFWGWIPLVAVAILG